MTTTQTQPYVELYARVDGVAYSVRVENRPEPDSTRHWVTVSKYHPEIDYWQQTISESVFDCGEPTEAIRTAFNRQRNKLCGWFDSWRDHRWSAAREKGGKRGYYTKHANAAHKWGMIYAAKWKLCRSIWKGITKL